MTQPKVELKHLDNLWFQVTGTLCNIACAHCFNSSGPNVRTFGFLSLERVRSELETAVRLGVREGFFTGGEPFLHPQLLEMLSLSLARSGRPVIRDLASRSCRRCRWAGSWLDPRRGAGQGTTFC